MTENSGETWYSNDTATFGDRLTGAREALGLTQRELADKLGVKLKTVRGWEEDLAEPRANKLQMLAGLLNVSLMWLLNGEGDGLTGPAEAADMPEELSDILTDLRKTKGEMARLTDHIGMLEKRLRKALKEEI